MAYQTLDAAFTAFCDAERRTLLGTAALLLADPVAADRLVQSSLAEIYRQFSNPHDARTAAYALVTRPDVTDVKLPWRPPDSRFELFDRFELIDRRPPAVCGVAMMADLAALPTDQRRVIVLEYYAQLPITEIAQIVGLDVATVRTSSEQARAALKGRDARRHDDLRLAEELADAAGNPGSADTDDLAHGRWLRRRRHVRTSALAAAGATLVLLAAAFLPGLINTGLTSTGLINTEQAIPGPSRGQLTSEWRSAMTAAAASHLHPGQANLTGYSFSRNNFDDSDSFWAGSGGALGLELFRKTGGATQVYLQVATSSGFAATCGTLTGSRCQTLQMMDGNRISVTESTTLKAGMEVQYSPDGRQVITVVAHNFSAGEELPLTRSQLIDLAEDPRLRLPGH